MALTDLGARTGPSPEHVVVIGGGVVGLCCADHLSRAGHRVTVVDRAATDYRGCSFGNAGMVTPSHFIPLAAPGMTALALRLLPDPEGPLSVRIPPPAGFVEWGRRFVEAATPARCSRAASVLAALGHASRALHRELAAELGDAQALRADGIMMVCREADTFHEEIEVAYRARELGIEAEVLAADEIERVETGVRVRAAGAVYFPGDMFLSPEALVRALRTRLVGRGVVFETGRDALGWRREGPRLRALVTRTGEIPGDAFVAAAGSWTGELLRRVGLNLPLQAGKGYSVTLDPAEKRPRVASLLLEARVAVTPMGEGVRFAGTMEFSGLDSTQSRARVRGMCRSIPGYLPDYAAETLERLPAWSGLRPCSPDGLPYVGRTRRASNLWIATGHAMLGVTLAPITGRLIAQMVRSEPPEIHSELLSPDRYA